MAFRQVRNGLEVGFAAPKDGNGLDLQEAVG
jgi:hypothetical protein